MVWILFGFVLLFAFVGDARLTSKAPTYCHLKIYCTSLWNGKYGRIEKGSAALRICKADGNMPADVVWGSRRDIIVSLSEAWMELPTIPHVSFIMVSQITETPPAHTFHPSQVNGVLVAMH